MQETNSSRRSRARTLSLLATPLTAIAVALATLCTPAAALTPARDLGVVAASTSVSAVVRLKGANDAAFDAAVAALNDSSSPTYHQWMQDAGLAAYAPSAQDLATAKASFAALGLNVDKVFGGGRLLHVSGSAAKMQAAFGTTIHALQSANGRTLLKATTTPTYKGAHAELVAGVSGLGGTATVPFVARQMNFATRQAVPFTTPQVGTNPLAAFTTHCFGVDFTETMSGFGHTPTGAGGAGGVVSRATGPNYLDPYSTTDRLTCGYNVQQLRQHYGLDEVHAFGLQGKGQTIVIVDAYGSPTAAADLNAFSAAMGLPPVTSQNFQVVYPDGAPEGSDPDWALETTLDIEWAHAFAPLAKIVLAVAPDQDNGELAWAVEYAAEQHLGNVVSNSWGLAENQADAPTAQMFDTIFELATSRGVAVNVATGDLGDNYQGSPVGGASIPADSRYVTAVGGTSIDIPSDIGPVESAWGIDVTSFGLKIQPWSAPVIGGFEQGGGGGESVYLAKPAWQHLLPGKGRQTPDISALADPQTGAIVTITTADGTQAWGVIGGTSLATPLFSAIWALANEAAGESLGQAAPIVAALPPFALRDVLPIQATQRNTTAAISFRGAPPTHYTAAQLLGVDKTQPTGFLGALVYVGQGLNGWDDVGFGLDSSLAAAPGWDNATGYGVPNGLQFIESAELYKRLHP